jgi:hypothetical protein
MKKAFVSVQLRCILYKRDAAVIRILPAAES